MDYNEDDVVEVDESGQLAIPIITGITALLASKYENEYGGNITDKELFTLLKSNTKDLVIKGNDEKYGGL